MHCANRQTVVQNRKENRYALCKQTNSCETERKAVSNLKMHGGAWQHVERKPLTEFMLCLGNRKGWKGMEGSYFPMFGWFKFEKKFGNSQVHSLVVKNKVEDKG